MFEYMLLIVGLLRAALRTRGNLLAENLLLRQQLAVLTRPTRRRPRLRARDKLFWLVVGVLRRDWRRHLVLVRPETVVPLAPPGVAAVLALEVARATRPPAPERRDPGADRADGARQPLLGRRADPRRAAQARQRRQRARRPAVPSPRTRSVTEPELADLPAQPPPEHLGRGPLHRADPHPSGALRP